MMSIIEILAALATATNRAAARDAIAHARKGTLVAAAAELRVAVTMRDSHATIVARMVDATVGAREDAAAIRAI